MSYSGLIATSCSGTSVLAGILFPSPQLSCCMRRQNPSSVRSISKQLFGILFGEINCYDEILLDASDAYSHVALLQLTYSDATYPIASSCNSCQNDQATHHQEHHSFRPRSYTKLIILSPPFFHWHFPFTTRSKGNSFSPFMVLAPVTKVYN
jgi:hypothetical protein